MALLVHEKNIYINQWLCARHSLPELFSFYKLCQEWGVEVAQINGSFTVECAELTGSDGVNHTHMVYQEVWSNAAVGQQERKAGWGQNRRERTAGRTVSPHLHLVS